MSVGKPIDTVVIGGGVVGMSVAYGLARAGERVRVLDEGDDAFRAARGNFGLVWVQGKGVGKPAYARWSMEAARLWAGVRDELTARTGIDLQLSQPGGLSLCLSDSELEQRSRTLSGLARDVGPDYSFEMLDAVELRELCPYIGTKVVGASYSSTDGHVSPIRLLRALAEGLNSLQTEILPGQHVDAIEYCDGVFCVRSGTAAHLAPKVVLAAGLGSARLGPMVGLDVPVAPMRGQILITERVLPFLDLPLATVRQTGDGGVQIGDSKEDVGFDDRSTTDVLSGIAERALRSFPILADLNIVRTWGALRVMTPDGYPIYQQSREYPGAFVVTCHSGITLVPHHMGSIAAWIHGGSEPPAIQDFKAERFHV
ncbi:MAG: FAD-dependent oxidoreductase [Devosia sp. 67-54]|uniref:NAD(P)/FAD-dependent oxidoreductase n=1 Tax=unclassified Devosia TaxID=196773 RepID=UPI00095FCF73|nr:MULTISPECIES: FAD-binding oxidoreductase [unclassified Devosia]MBN9306985.1 FAD-binding oxidoreductase [Devosia sp.]OJX16928.1 MAG: FAD-dependent oxidoreductase [Devosia sp. 67-54]